MLKVENKSKEEDSLCTGVMFITLYIAAECLGFMKREEFDMNKQYFSTEQDGFYGAYYPNAAFSGKAVIVMLERFEKAIAVLKMRGNDKIGIVGVLWL